MPTGPLLIRPIAAAHLDHVRESGRDAWGSPVEELADAPGSPLRCCLRNSRPGEGLILFGYAPPIPGAPSPYQEVGAVFAHAAPCDGAPLWTSYPDEWLDRPQVLRAYDSRGWIHPATTTHDGKDAERALREVLSAPGVVEVHSRNIAYGCFMFSASCPGRNR
ncbi:MAG: DUF1203 domain-containing protein [Mycobacterium sp.]|nr:DUF1203 domain-containing protein [Mycobacterium sp.]